MMITKPNRRLTPAPVQKSGPPKVWPYWPQETGRPRRSGWRWLTFFGLGGALALGVGLVLVVAAALAVLFRSDTILPGVYAGETALGGYSMTEAIALLQEDWRQQRISLEPGEGTGSSRSSLPVIPETVGINLDPEATARLAHRQGRTLAGLVELITTGKQVQIDRVWRFRPDLAQKNLEILAAQFESPAREARLRLSGGRVDVVPALPGQKLDVEATIARLSQNPSLVVDEGRLELAMKPIPATATDLSAAAAEANQLLAQPAAVRVYDPVSDEGATWQMEAGVWSGWLRLEVEVGDPAQLVWSLDQSQARAYLAGKAESLGPERFVDLDGAVAAFEAALRSGEWPVRLMVQHHPRQHTVQPGETLSSIGYDYGIPYPWIEQANPDLGLRLSPGQVVTIPSPDGLLPLPAVENKRLVVSLSEQKVWAYENGVVKWEWPASTGIASSPTAPGVFQVQSHELNAYAANWNLWMPHFIGIYRPVPTSDFMNGFHGFPTRNGSTLLWTDDLGHPVTYGCVLVSSENAALLYDWAEPGVVVEVRK